MKRLLKVSRLATLIICIIFLYATADKNVSVIDQKDLVKLSEKEKTWLRKHPDIVLGYTDTFEPEVIVNPDGSLRGMQVELLAELNRRLGTRISLQIYPIPQLLEKSQKKEIDGILSLHSDFADELELLKTRGTIVGYPAVFARKNVPFNSLSDFNNKRIAVIDQVFFSRQIIEFYVKDPTILKVKDAMEAFTLLNREAVDYFLGASLNAYLIAKYQLFGLTTQYVFYDLPIDGVIGTRADWPELSTILDKGLSSFSREEIEAIVEKWSQLPGKLGIMVETDQAEQAWLDKNHTVRVRVTDYPPYIILGGGQPSGISIDYLEHISAQAGINFQYVEEIRPCEDAYQSMKRFQGPDLILCFEPPRQRETEILTSNAYISTPSVIYMRDDAEFISGMAGLSGKTVAVLRGILMSGLFPANFPDSNFVHFDSDFEAIRAVSTGQADAYIGNIMVASFIIQQYNLSNLKIAAPSFLEDHAFSFGIRPDWPELTSIINKVLDNMSKEQHAAIRNKYIAIRYEQGINPAEVKKWMLIGIGIGLGTVLIFLFLNRSLRNRVRERTSILAESEARFRATFEQAAVGIAHVAPDGRFLRINQKFCTIVGYSHDEMLTKIFQDITHPEDLSSDLKLVDQMLEKEIETYTIEKRYLHKNGKTVWVNLTVSLLCDQSGNPKYFISVIEDISQRKKVEAERDRILTQSQDLICIAGMDGYFKFLNPAWEKILGYAHSELLAKPFLKFIHPDDHDKNVAEVENLKSGQVTLEFENRYIHKDGTIRNIDWTAVPILDENVIYCIGRDITKRKNTEIKFRQSEERYRTLFEGSQNGIIFADVSTRKFKYANPAAAEMLGYTIEELCNLGVDDIHPPEELERVYAEFDAQIRGESMLAYQLPCLKKDGRIIYANVNANQLTTTEGNFSVGFFTDVSEHKMTEEALRQSEEKFQDLMEQSSISIQIHDPDGKLVQSNAAYARLFALNEDTLNELYEKYNVLEDEQARRLGLMPHIEKVFNGEESIFPNYEYNGIDTLKTLDFKNPVSRTCWVQTHGYPIKDKDGNVTRVVFMSEDISERKQTEKKLLNYQKKLKSLASELILIEEKERRRIATDLHDHIGQILASTRFQLASVMKTVDDSGILAKLEDISKNIRYAVNDTRGIISELSSPSLKELGFAAAISEWMEEHVEGHHGLKTSLTCKIKKLELDEDVGIMLYRSVRELLTNVIKHARASKVEVIIETHEDMLKLRVQDNGIGFRYDQQWRSSKAGRRLGLFSIHERMAELGGEMQIKAAKLKGTEVTLIAPLK